MNDHGWTLAHRLMLVLFVAVLGAIVLGGCGGNGDDGVSDLMPVNCAKEPVRCK